MYAWFTRYTDGREPERVRGRLFRFPRRLGIVALGLGIATAWLASSFAGGGMPPVAATDEPARKARSPATSSATERVVSLVPEAGSPLLGRARRESMDPGPDPITDPSTEREFYEAFKRQGIDSLELTAREGLEKPGPDCRRVAVLRALYDLRSPRYAELFTWAIRNLPSAATPVGESVASFAVRFLGDKAGRDPQARSALENVAFASQPQVAPGLRRRAAASLGATASETELQGLSMRLAHESDHLLVEGVFAALDRNPNKAAAAAVLSAFGRPMRMQGSSSPQAGQTHRTRKERLP